MCGTFGNAGFDFVAFEIISVRWNMGNARLRWIGCSTSLFQSGNNIGCIVDTINLMLDNVEMFCERFDVS